MKNSGLIINLPKYLYDKFFKKLNGHVIESRKGVKLHMSNVKLHGIERGDTTKQLNAKLKGGTFGELVTADMTITGANNKVLDKQKDWKLAILPVETDLSSYIVKGNDWQFAFQTRLKQGVFVRRQREEHLYEAYVNAAGGATRIIFDTNTQQFKYRVQNRHFHLYSILHDLGLSDIQLAHSWGNTILAKNKAKYKEGVVDELYKKFRPYVPATDVVADVLSYMKSKELDKDVTKFTLGKAYGEISPELLLTASAKVLKLADDKVPADDTEHLAHQYLLDAGDISLERLEKGLPSIDKIVSKILDRSPTVSTSFSPTLFNNIMEGTFTQNDLSRYNDMYNPISIARNRHKLTFMGEGGIKSTYAVPDEKRLIHHTQKQIIDPTGTPECFSDDTEVFTNKGWVPWTDVDYNTHFACLTNADELFFAQAVSLFAEEYHGEMCGFESTTVKYLVTPNHRMWVRPTDPGSKYRFETAESIHAHKATRVMPITAVVPYRGTSQDTFTLPEVEVGCGNQTKFGAFALDDWAEFLGWYIAEGHTGGNYRVRVTQVLTANPDNVETISDLLDALGLTWSYDGKDFTTCGKQLASYFKRFGLCHEKYIPQQAFAWPASARQRLLDGLMGGDGKSDGSRYDTTSELLAKGVERLLISLGVSCRISEREDNRQPQYKKMYAVNIHSRKTRQIKTDENWHARKDFVKYDGMVYCATVPGSRLYCRRKGCGAFWSGNSGNIGITNTLTIGAKKIGKDFALDVYDTKGKLHTVTAVDLADKKMGFYNDFDWSSGKPTPRRKTIIISSADGSMSKGPASSIDYIYRSAKMFHDPATNAVPFVGSSSSNRVLMGSKHYEQAIALKNPEAPLVQNEFKRGIGYEDYVGKNLKTSAVSGVVVKVAKDKIVVKLANGTDHTIYLRHNYPLNESSFYTESATVKVGEKVKKGQQIAETAYNRNGGGLSLGRNIRTAYMPYYGYNFEDGLVISQSCADKFTSLHKAEEEIELSKDHIYGVEAYLFHFPAMSVNIHPERFDSKDLPKKGEVFRKGDVLLPCVVKSKPSPDMSADRLIKRLGYQAMDMSSTWTKSHPGTVVKAIRTGKMVKVLLSYESSMGEGDKLCLTPDHDVLTAEGWKPISTITTADSVCTLNGGVIEYNKPGSIFTYSIDEDVYELETQQLSIMATLNHKLYVKRRYGVDYELIAANQVLGKRVRFKKDGVNTNTDTPTITLPAHAHRSGRGENQSRIIPEKVIALKPFLQLVGFIIGDGWITANTKAGNYRISICQIKPNHIQWLKQLFKTLEIKYNFTQSTHTYSWRDKQLWLWLHKIGVKARNKRIPRELMSYSASDLKYLWEGLFKSDGSICNSGSEMYITSSKQLADDVQELALKVGWSANIKVLMASAVTGGLVNGHQIIAKHDVYHVRIVKAKNQPQINHGHVREQDAQLEHITHYKGEVYSFDVKNHIYYTRRNGKPMWTGNSEKAGAKGIVTRVVPDKDMLRDKEGNVIDLVFNPYGVPGRINPNHIFEAALGKVGLKKGKQLVKMYSNNNTLANVKARVKDSGVKLNEDLFDPVSGETIKDVFVGVPFFFKLTHVVDKKFSARGAGPGSAYTIEESPKRSKGSSGQSAGALEVYSLLAGGAKHYLNDVSTLLSQKNDEWWTNYQLGLPSKELDTPFVVQKLLSYMKAAGINLSKDGDTVRAVPLTDADILAMSSGEVHNAKVVDAKMNPEKGGLFDEAITGGMGGTYWNHIELSQPVPNPLAEEAIRRVLDLKTTEFKAIMNGKLAYNSKTKSLVKTDENDGENDGFLPGRGEDENRVSNLAATPRGSRAVDELMSVVKNDEKVRFSGNKNNSKNDIGLLTQGFAFEQMLKDINIAAEVKSTRKELEQSKPTARDGIVKKLRFLSSLKEMKKRPEDVYILRNVAVLPAKFRPIYATPDGKTNISDPTQFYRETILINNQIKDLKRTGFDLNTTPDLGQKLYQSVKGVIGLADPQTPKAMFKGLLKIIKGRENKTGLFQGRVVARRRDLTGRSTVIVDPKLGLDDVGLPKKMALKLYEPFIRKHLITLGGYTPIEARKMIDDEYNRRTDEREEDTRVIEAARAVVADRPTYLSRAPALHKQSVLAFKPQLVDGKAIKVNPLIVSGFGMDFDGDSQKYCYINGLCSSSFIINVLTKKDFIINQRKLQDYLELLVTNMDLRATLNLDNLLSLSKEEITMLKKELVTVFKDEIPVRLLLDEFPHKGNAYLVKGVRYYKVPEGIKVWSIDKEGKHEALPVSDFTVHEDIDMYSVTYHRHGSAFVSKDNTVLAIDDAYKLTTTLTQSCVGKLSPYLHNKSRLHNPTIFNIDLEKYVKIHGVHSKPLVSTDFKLGKLEGYLLGAFVGDGWCGWKPKHLRNSKNDRPGTVAIASISKEIVAKIRQALSKYMPLSGEYVYENPHEFNGHKSHSTSYRWTCANFSCFLYHQIGSGSANKRLPEYFAEAPRSFLLGMLSGLIDTDGTINLNKNNRFAVSYHSENLHLIKDVQYLLSLLGIFSSISPYVKKLHGVDKTYYNLTISTVDFANQLRDKIEFQAKHKQDVWEKLQAKEFNATDRNISRMDPIPITTALAIAMMKNHGAPRTATVEHKRIYGKLNEVTKKGYGSRALFKEVLANLSPDFNHEHLQQLRKYVADTNLRWDIVKSVEYVGKETMYDITVPGTNTFMTADSMFFYDSVIGNVQALRHVSVRPIKAKLDLPVVSCYNDDMCYDYLPELNISRFVDCDLSEKTSPVTNTVLVPGISLYSNETGLFGVEAWHKEMCGEVITKTWYGKVLTTSASHSLVCYDVGGEKFVQVKPGDAKFKCMPCMLGYEGELQSLFRLANDAAFTMLTLLLTRVSRSGSVIYYTKKEDLLKQLQLQLNAVGCANDLYIDDGILEITDKDFSHVLKTIFYIDSGKRLPKPIWQTTLSYRRQALKALASYSMFVIRQDNKVYPAVRLANRGLAREIQRFLKSLGIQSTIHSADGRGRMIIRMSREAYFYREELGLRAKIKPVGVVPVTDDELTSLRSITDSNLQHGFVPRWVLDDIKETGRALPQTLQARMDKIKGFYLDAIIDVKATGEVKEMYDLTVPQSHTFTMNDGCVVNDTASTAVPVSEEARLEALNTMLPSNHIFSGRGNHGESLINTPAREFVLGIYLMTKPVQPKPIQTFASDQAALQALAKKEIAANDSIKVKTAATTAGRILVRKAFPDGMKVENKTMDKKYIIGLLTQAAKKYPTKTAEIMNTIKDYGAYFSTVLGFSFTLNDFGGETKARDKIMNDAIKKVKTKGFEPAMLEAKKLMQDLLKRMESNSWVKAAILSGVMSGKAEQIQQMILSPIAVVDHNNKAVEVPLTKSFSEGFTLPEYWAGLPGSRKGLMGRSLSTADTGAFGKTLLAAAAGVVISGIDCGTSEGVELPLSSNDVLDRYIIGGRYNGQLMTTALQAEMRVKTVMVRSPLKCKYMTGICQKCWGLLETGKLPEVGFAIGALAGTTAAEPVTQLVMKAFHTGGTIGAKDLRWRRVEDLVKVPKTVPNRGVICKVSGVVESITAVVGGYNVVVNGESYNIAKRLGLRVKKGDKVKAGDQLDRDGAVHPQDLLDATHDINRVEDFMISELDSTYRSGGVKIKRKILETLVAPMTRKVYVTGIDPSTAIETGIFAGDTISRGQAAVLKKNRNAKFKAEPKIVGVGQLPHEAFDFIGELMSDQPHNTLAKAPLLRKGFNIHGHPITKYVFGKSDDTKVSDEISDKKRDLLIRQLINVFDAKGGKRR